METDLKQNADSPSTAQSEVGVLRHVWLQHARDAFQSQEFIDHQWRELGYLERPDLARAVEENDQFVEHLRNAGAQIDFLPSSPDLSIDSIYVRDATVFTSDGLILCRMGKTARAGEPEAQRRAAEAMGVDVIGAISGAGRLEGGDFVWLGERVAAVGLGYRTNLEGIRQLRLLLEGLVDELIVVPLPHWKGPDDVFHLMSMISPLDQDLAVVYAPLLPVPFRDRLLSIGIELVEVPNTEFDSMGANVLATAPRRALMLDGNPVTRGRLEDAGVQVTTYQGWEISGKGCGGPTCLTRPLLRGV